MTDGLRSDRIGGDTSFWLLYSFVRILRRRFKLSASGKFNFSIGSNTSILSSIPSLPRTFRWWLSALNIALCFADDVLLGSVSPLTSGCFPVCFILPFFEVFPLFVTFFQSRLTLRGGGDFVAGASLDLENKLFIEFEFL